MRTFDKLETIDLESMAKTRGGAQDCRGAEDKATGASCFQLWTRACEATCGESRTRQPTPAKERRAHFWQIWK